MNLFDIYKLYREQINDTGLTGSIKYLSLEPVDPGHIRVLTHVTAENKTNASTKFRLLIKHHARTFYIDELSAPAAGELAVNRSDILLGEADILQCEFTGTTTGDELVLTAIGWELLK